MNSGVVFRWLPSNQKEIKNHRMNNGRTPNLQAFVNKMHLDYIATRPGAALNDNAHGLFGYIYDENKNILADCNNLKLEEIEKRVGEMSSIGIDVFKTVISLTEEDASNYGYTTREAWQGLLELRINDIAKEYKIPISDLEWTASYHSERGHLHCHLLFWDRNQYDENKNNAKKPFVNYKNIRKSFAKEIFNEEYQEALQIKNISKKMIENLAEKNVDLYFEHVRKEYKNNDIEFNVVDTFKEEKLIEDIKRQLDINQKIYLYDKTNPGKFIEIQKVYQKKYNWKEKCLVDDDSKEPILTFKNGGENSLLYKENDELNMACFLSNFENIKQTNSLENLKDVIANFNENNSNIENILREISPQNMPQNIFTNRLKKNKISVIVNMILVLENYIKQENKKIIRYRKS